VLNTQWDPKGAKQRDAYFTSWGNGSLDPYDIMNPTDDGRAATARFPNAEVDKLLTAAETERHQEAVRRVAGAGNREPRSAVGLPLVARISMVCPSGFRTGSRARTAASTSTTPASRQMAGTAESGDRNARAIVSHFYSSFRSFWGQRIVFLMITLTPSDPVEIMLGQMRRRSRKPCPP
jgi:hypothetical protein